MGITRPAGLWALLFVFVTSTGLTSCTDEQVKPIVIYVSADEYVARPILEEFERRTDIPVLMVGDAEANKTTGLVDRIRAEQTTPVADVWWSSEAFMTIALAEEGLLQPHHSEYADAWPAAWRDESGRWYGFSPRPRVVVARRGVLGEADRPRSLEDLADPQWSSQLVMADPRFGTTGGHFAALARWYEQRGEGDEFRRFLRALARNNIRLLPGGNAAVVEAVANGQAVLGLTDTDDVRAANRNGEDLVMYPLGPRASVGTFLMPNTVGRVAGSTNPAAGQLVDYLLSERVARALAESTSGNIPLDPAVAASYPELQVESAMPTDLAAVAARYREVVTETFSVLSAGNVDASP